MYSKVVYKGCQSRQEFVDLKLKCFEFRCFEKNYNWDDVNLKSEGAIIGKTVEFCVFYSFLGLMTLYSTASINPKVVNVPPIMAHKLVR